jgi:hypothetical protein
MKIVLDGQRRKARNYSDPTLITASSYRRLIGVLKSPARRSLKHPRLFQIARERSLHRFKELVQLPRPLVIKAGQLSLPQLGELLIASARRSVTCDSRFNPEADAVRRSGRTLPRDALSTNSVKFHLIRQSSESHERHPAPPGTSPGNRSLRSPGQAAARE